MNGKHELFMLMTYIRTKFTNRQAKYRNLIKASKVIGVEVNFDKTKYMITSRHKKVQNENTGIENVQNIKYLQLMVTNTNDIREESKRILNIES